MSTTLGGVTLKDPYYDEDGSSADSVDVGAFLTMANGSIVYDYTTTRQRFKVAWRGLTAAEFAAIETQALTKTSQAYSPPEAVTEYTVFVVPGSWKWKSFEVGTSTPYWNCEMALEEVA